MKEVKKILLLNLYIGVTMLLSVCSYAQPSDTLLQFDFINYDENKIQFFGKKPTYSRFYDKLNQLINQGKGKINILQFGGSHIQADIWSHQLRTRFQQLYSSKFETRGLLFPYRLAHTNNPSNYRVSYTGNWQGYRSSVSAHNTNWGLTGITATTTDSVSSFSIHFAPTNELIYCFDQVKVFHNGRDTNYTLKLTGNQIAQKTENNGDGCSIFYLDYPDDSLTFTITKKDSAVVTPFELYGLLLETSQPGIRYHGIGVNGASTNSYQRCTLFSQHIAAIPPDLVIFCIGINDAYHPDFDPLIYQHNYDSIIEKIQLVTPEVEILFVTNNDSYYQREEPNPRIELVKESMLELCERHQAGLWDMHTIMGGLGSISTWEQHQLAQPDKIHFTDSGYITVGNLLFSAFMKSYKKYLAP